jgi:hypothetical protein
MPDICEAGEESSDCGDAVMIWQIHKSPRKSFKCRMFGHVPAEYVCKLGHLHCSRCRIVLHELVPIDELERWRTVEILRNEIQKSEPVREIVKELESWSW